MLAAAEVVFPFSHDHLFPSLNMQDGTYSVRLDLTNKMKATDTGKNKCSPSYLIHPNYLSLLAKRICVIKWVPPRDRNILAMCLLDKNILPCNFKQVSS